MDLQTLEMSVRCGSSPLRMALAVTLAFVTDIFVQDCADYKSLPAGLKNENGRKAVLRKANYLNIWEERVDSHGDSRVWPSYITVNQQQYPRSNKNNHKTFSRFNQTEESRWSQSMDYIHQFVHECLHMLKEGLQHYCQLLSFWYFPRWLQSHGTGEMKLTKHTEIKCSLQGHSKALLLDPDIAWLKTQKHILHSLPWWHLIFRCLPPHGIHVTPLDT